MKLTDTQTAALTAAAARPDGAILPLPAHIRGGASGKVCDALVANGLTTAIIVLVVIIAVQQLESNILQPILQSKAMNLHPVVILLGVAAGGTLFGIVGAFLAVPILAVVAVMLRYLGEQIDLRTGDVTASDLASATDEGRLTAWLGEMSSSRFAPLRKSSSAIMAGIKDTRPGPVHGAPDSGSVGATGPGDSVVGTLELDDDEVVPPDPDADDPSADQANPPTGPVDPKSVYGNRPSPSESKPNALRRFGRFLARRLES